MEFNSKDPKGVTFFFSSYLRCLHQDPIGPQVNHYILALTERETKIELYKERVLTKDVAKHKIHKQ
jgi:hypothetical protein